MAGKVLVVGVDGSLGSEHALRWTLGYAQRVGGRVRAVLAWDYPALAVLPAPLGMPVPPPERMAAAALVGLRRALEAAGLAGAAVEIEEVVQRGSPAEVLIHEGREADLLVVGTRGRGRLASVVFGSVSRRVASVAPCPVAVVPPQAALDAAGPVVVGVDGSAASLAALAWAGSATDGPIHAVYVFERPVGPEHAVEGFEWDDPDELGRKLVEHSVAKALGDRPNVTTAARAGDPREVLADPALGASLLVVGSQGATGVEGAFLGSVATGLASTARVPVVVVPATELPEASSKDKAHGEPA